MYGINGLNSYEDHNRLSGGKSGKIKKKKIYVAFAFLIP